MNTLTNLLTPEIIENLWGLFPQGLVVFDLEMSGLTPFASEIIEIAAIAIAPGEAIRTFNSLVRPQNQISPASTAIHKISNEMVAGEENLAAVLPRFLNFCGPLPLWGHGIKVDIGFLVYNLARLQLGNRERLAFYDSRLLAKQILPQLPSYKLAALTEQLALNHVQEHRALSDALATLKLLCHLAHLALQQGAHRKDYWIEKSFSQSFAAHYNFGQINTTLPPEFLPLLPKIAEQAIVQIKYSSGQFKRQFRPIKVLSLLPSYRGITLHGICQHDQMNKQFFLERILEFYCP